MDSVVPTLRMRVLVATPLVLLSAVTLNCAKGSKTTTPAESKTEKVVTTPTCPAAVAEEFELLAAAIRTDPVQAELADDLDGFAAKPVITTETVASFTTVRAIAQNIASREALVALKRAEDTTVMACKTIDTPEQQAQDAVDDAIKLLAAKEVRTLLERYMPPQELAEMKSNGEYEEVLARFEGEWGVSMLEQLQESRKGPPTINDDGSIEFRASGPVTFAPKIDLVLIEGRWYFKK